MVQKQKKEQSVEVIENGNIYFCYRPKVETQNVKGLDDVQRFYMVLRPHGKQSYRLIVLGQKQLPDVKHHGEKTWGFVDSVSDSAQQIEQELREKNYQTKTRGKREQPTARPVGEGVYDIIRHEDHTHLVYALELPEDIGPAQKALDIQPEGSYILSIKNPEKPSPQNAGLSNQQKADLPKQLQKQFEGHRFINANPPEFLDYSGIELLLISAASDVSEELGIELHPEDETEATAEIINDLRMRKSRHPIEPLLTGQWK
ncbi:MAG: hypothetical protein ACOC04_03190 [Halothece sp.]